MLLNHLPNAPDYRQKHLIGSKDTQIILFEINQLFRLSKIVILSSRKNALQPAHPRFITL
jgi:hypothetical protein